MTYCIKLVRKQETFFGYRNTKGEWTAAMSAPESATSFKTKSGAQRALVKGDAALASVSGFACWHDLLQNRGYEVSVVNTRPGSAGRTEQKHFTN